MMKTLVERQLSSDFINALNELVHRKVEEPLLLNVYGQKFVVLREEDYRGWNETAYLLSSSKNAEILRNALDEPLEECKDLSDVFPTFKPLDILNG